MKKKRHTKILELIQEQDIETQEELLAYLAASGIPVTQATVSRDIRELGLTKVKMERSGCKYVMPKPENGAERKFHELFLHAVLTVDYAVNTVVLHCDTGTAQAACAVFDSMGFSNVVGTLAGDDTVFILLRSEQDAAGLCQLIQKQLEGKE